MAGWDRPDNRGESDLYVSFRDKSGNWTELINMGAPVNTQNIENNAMLTPDGKYLMLMRVSEENNIISQHLLDFCTDNRRSETRKNKVIRDWSQTGFIRFDASQFFWHYHCKVSRKQTV